MWYLVSNECIHRCKYLKDCHYYVIDTQFKMLHTLSSNNSTFYLDFELTNTCSLIRVQLISSIARAHKTANYVSTDLIAPTISRITLIHI